MFPQWGPIVFYDLFTLLGFVTAAWMVDRLLSGIPPIRKGPLRVALLLSFFVSLYGGALIPYLYGKMAHDPVPFYLGSGRYFHSAFLTVLAYLVLVFKLFRWPLGKGLDAYLLAALAMSAVGRIGCFLEGCCRGKPTSLPWGMVFPDHPGARLHPTQLYMFFAETALLFFLIRFARKKEYDGQIFWVGVWFYSLYRILIEILRTNPIFLWGLSHAQAFSILTLAVSSWVLLRPRQVPETTGPR